MCVLCVCVCMWVCHYVCVCVCVYVCVCVCVCMWVCHYVCVCICCMCVIVYTYVYVCVCVLLYTFHRQVNQDKIQQKYCMVKMVSQNILHMHFSEVYVYRRNTNIILSNALVMHTPCKC